MVVQSDESVEKFSSITASPEYQHKSFEELRLDNYFATGKVVASISSPAKAMSSTNEKRKHTNEDKPNPFVFPNKDEDKEPTVVKSALDEKASDAPSSGFAVGFTTTTNNNNSNHQASSFGWKPTAETLSTDGTNNTPSSSSGFKFQLNASSNINNGGFKFTPSKEVTNSSVSTSTFNFTPPKAVSTFGASSKKKVYRASLKSKTTDSLEGYEHYRSFMDKLAESGVDDYVDLPMIAVMGDTSSGKSSLLSNISLVELPSSDTLTTRCPIRLQMRNAETKEARVKVVWKDKPEKPDSDFAEKTVGEDNWSELTDMIAEAQSHIIEKTGKDVARDIVCIDMKGPHCENLTLIDLPGIVRSTGKGESSTLAEDIQALMNDYLSNERCVILAVLPANVDFHNSQILNDAKMVDPTRSRTIPVLTKPDLIDDGAESNVKDLLLGDKTEQFGMGFHMVKGRGQKELNDDVGIEDGLTKEEAFFRNKEPWRSVEDKSLFGTKSLRVKLAELQMKLIHSSFDSIISEMKIKRDEAAQELKSLGALPSTLSEKRALFRKVREEIREGLGTESTSGRISTLHSNVLEKRPSAEFLSSSKQFQSELQSSKLANLNSIKTGSKIIALVGSKELRDTVSYIDDTNGNVFIISHKKKVNKSPEKWNTKLDGLFIYDGNAYVAKTSGLSRSFYQLLPISLKLARIDPQWICELIEKNRPYNLPIFLNPDLFNAIVADKIENEWKTPATKLLLSTVILMERASSRFIKELDMIKSLPPLTNYLITTSSEVLDTIKEETEQEILKFIEREKTPYTQNHYLFENLNKLRTQRLLDAAKASILLHTDDEDVITNSSSLISDIQQLFEVNQKRSIDDHMAEEMSNALDSYGKVAFKRFVDSVPMIAVQIMKRFPAMLNDILSDLTDDEIEKLVVAPPGAISDMNALKKEVETLEKGIDTVKDLSKGGCIN